jgi:hypothetical protein
MLSVALCKLKRQAPLQVSGLRLKLSALDNAENVLTRQRCAHPVLMRRPASNMAQSVSYVAHAQFADTLLQLGGVLVLLLAGGIAG